MMSSYFLRWMALWRNGKTAQCEGNIRPQTLKGFASLWSPFGNFKVAV
jgi:hypothetical protein